MPPLSLFRRRVRGDFSHEIGPRSGSLLCKTPISCAFRKNELVVFDKSDNDRIKYFVKKLNERRENFVAASKKNIRRFIVPTQREHDEKTAGTVISQIISKKNKSCKCCSRQNVRYRGQAGLDRIPCALGPDPTALPLVEADRWTFHS